MEEGKKEPMTEVLGKNKVKRLRERAAYDEESIHKILDSAYIAHVGIVQMNEQNEPEPIVIPMVRDYSPTKKN